VEAGEAMVLRAMAVAVAVLVVLEQHLDFL
jgi:hypothetical protein